MNNSLLRRGMSLGALLLAFLVSPMTAVAQDVPTDAPAAAAAAPANAEAARLADAGDFAGARKIALADLRSGKVTSSAEFWSYVERDPMMSHTLDAEVQPHGSNYIAALGGGSTVSFKYRDSEDESMKAALKPDQDLRTTMYRSGIAFYRMCTILGCSFKTAVTRPARFSKDDFNKLYSATDAKSKGYKSKFTHLIWKKEDGKEYLYVGFKEWIPDFDHFPIEATAVWSPYLKNPKAELPPIDEFLKKMLEAGRENAMRKSYKKILGYMEGVTTRELLQQISDMILIDYLTNNWDRFSESKNSYGANCNIQKGGLVAIDNDAAFPPWHTPRVVKRIRLVEMFSRELVENLRTLNEDELLEHLFPNAPKSEKANLQRFRERRADALKYIDELIAKKGEENVLVF